MKLFSTYVKEMKIAFRGFYFYIEIFVAVIALIILLVAVKENPDGKIKEYVFNDISSDLMENIYDEEINKGTLRLLEDTEFTIKANEFVLLNKETEEETSFEMKDKEKVMVRTYEKLDAKTGDILGKMYVFDKEEDMIRMSYDSGVTGVSMVMNESGEMSYKYYLQGYETERYEEILYLSHALDVESMIDVQGKQTITIIGDSEQLNNREAVVPVFIGFSGALMGFFIIMSYVFLDKSQGVIKAFAVTPSSIWSYLLTKTFVILTTVIISSTIVVIPIMKLKPNYFLFYVFLIAASFMFSCLGLLIASFFDTISKAFGVLYLFMIGLMIPVFSYYIGSFDPLWVRVLPTYPLLQGFKDIMIGNPDVAYILTYTGVFVGVGIVLLALANARFKKTLTV